MKTAKIAAAALAGLLGVALMAAPAAAADTPAKGGSGEAAALVKIIEATETGEAGKVRIVLGGVSKDVRPLLVTLDAKRLTPLASPTCTYKQAKAAPAACTAVYEAETTASGGHGVDVLAGKRLLSAEVSTTQNQARTDWAQQTLELVNEVRAKAGAGPLSLCPALSRAAQGYADWAINTPDSTWHHIGEGGSTYVDRILAQGYGSSFLGENLAGNFTVAGAMSFLIASPGHYANMVNPGFTHLGVGRAGSSPYLFVHAFGAGGNCA